MTSIVALWMPILASAAAMFIISSVIHMVLKYHNSNYQELPEEERIREALGPLNIAPDDYMMPYGCDMNAMKDPVFQEKMKQGPVFIMTVWKNGPPNIGASLAQWFIFCVLISGVAAYVTGRALDPGAAYLDVFRFAGTIVFCTFGLGAFPDSIWFKRQWTTTFKYLLDGLLYGLATGAIFGWLWPAA